MNPVTAESAYWRSVGRVVLTLALWCSAVSSAGRWPPVSNASSRRTSCRRSTTPATARRRRPRPRRSTDNGYPDRPPAPVGMTSLFH